MPLLERMPTEVEDEDKLELAKLRKKRESSDEESEKDDEIRADLVPAPQESHRKRKTSEQEDVVESKVLEKSPRSTPDEDYKPSQSIERLLNAKLLQRFNKFPKESMSNSHLKAVDQIEKTASDSKVSLRSEKAHKSATNDDDDDRFLRSKSLLRSERSSKDYDGVLESRKSGHTEKYTEISKDFTIIESKVSVRSEISQNSLKNCDIVGSKISLRTEKSQKRSKGESNISGSKVSVRSEESQTQSSDDEVIISTSVASRKVDSNRQNSATDVDKETVKANETKDESVHIQMDSLVVKSDKKHLSERNAESVAEDLDKGQGDQWLLIILRVTVIYLVYIIVCPHYCINLV